MNRIEILCEAVGWRSRLSGPFATLAGTRQLYAPAGSIALIGLALFPSHGGEDHEHLPAEKIRGK